MRMVSNVPKIINSNTLKIIAIIAMIIDHIGYYFSFCLDENVYDIMRIIGRVAMPIFVFLLVQGYKKTSDVKKYLFRLSIYAMITQIFILLIYVINILCVPEYSISIAKVFNILFSFCFTIILFIAIDKKTKIINIKFQNKKISNLVEIIIRFLLAFIIISIYVYVKVDYGFIVPFMALGIYLTLSLYEYLKLKDVKKFEYISSIIYYLGISLTIIICGLFESNYSEYVGLSLIFIFLYNEKLGRKNKKLQNIYYMIFPLQHALLYILALCLKK